MLYLPETESFRQCLLEQIRDIYNPLIYTSLPDIQNAMRQEAVREKKFVDLRSLDE